MFGLTHLITIFVYSADTLVGAVGFRGTVAAMIAS